MDHVETRALLADAAELVRQLYVFPDIGRQLGDLLDTNADDGRYDDTAQASELAEAVTRDLQSLNGDKHLRLRYEADEIPDLPGDEMLLAMVSTQARQSLNGVAGIGRHERNIAHLELGPVLFPPAIAGESITAAMTVVADADALILDLRGTLGGDPTTVALVCSYLFDEPTHLIDFYERESDTVTQSWTLAYVPGRRFGATKPLYVLTSSATFSGGEELAYDLQQLGRATVVGEVTGGGAHPRVGRRMHPHLELTVPTGRPISPTSGTNWEGVGVRPDVPAVAAQALDVALEHALHAMPGTNL
jgi:Peptidase family S41/N-terminal domain of Peptidase_S41 in eukaryotic IRBP